MDFSRQGLELTASEFELRHLQPGRFPTLLRCYLAAFGVSAVIALGLPLCAQADVAGTREAGETVAEEGEPAGESESAAEEGEPAGEGEPAAQEGEPAGEGESAAEEGEAPTQEGQTPEGRQQTRPVALESTRLEVNIPIESNSEPAEAATEELRKRGRLGKNDLLLQGTKNQVEDTVFARAQQQHQGIPVYGASVVVTIRDGRIVGINGHPAPDIQLNTITPSNDYAATIALAEAILANEITAQDEGLLVIFATPAGHRLAWRGIVLIDGMPEEGVFDAETGEVLLRASLIQDLDGLSLGRER